LDRLISLHDEIMGNKIAPTKLAKCLNNIFIPYHCGDFRFLKTATIKDFRIFIIALHSIWV